MDYQKEREHFGSRLQALRTERSLTQEQPGELLNKSTEHISFLERGDRSPSFEMLLALARTLKTSVSDLCDFHVTVPNPVVEVVAASSALPPLSRAAVSDPEQRIIDLQRLDAAMDGLRDMQRLADHYGVRDILQDNGGKVLQLLIVLGLKMLPAFVL